MDAQETGRGSIIFKGESKLHPGVATSFWLALVQRIKYSLNHKAPGCQEKNISWSPCSLPQGKGSSRGSSHLSAQKANLFYGLPVHSCSWRPVGPASPSPWVPGKSLFPDSTWEPHHISLRLLTRSRSRHREKREGYPEGSAMLGRPFQS